MTTGKLNCVSEQDRQASRNPQGISAAMGKHAATAWRRSCVRPELKLRPNVTFKGWCKQRSGWSAGMACEGRARNRMLRKRWIVRNPVVGEDDVTQLILARPFNTSWLHGFLSAAKKEKTTLFTWSGMKIPNQIVPDWRRRVVLLLERN